MVHLFVFCLVLELLSEARQYRCPAGDRIAPKGLAARLKLLPGVLAHKLRLHVLRYLNADDVSLSVDAQLTHEIRDCFLFHDNLSHVIS